LKELRERVIKKQNEHTVNMDSVKFDFE
jgi:hypothetical protein